MAVVAEALRYLDRVNDGRPDSNHQPLCAWIYGTAEVRKDKLDQRGRAGASAHLIPGCFIFNYHPHLGPYSGVACRTLSPKVLFKFLKDKKVLLSSSKKEKMAEKAKQQPID